MIANVAVEDDDDVTLLLKLVLVLMLMIAKWIHICLLLKYGEENKWQFFF